jgi:hypothetical protein
MEQIVRLKHVTGPPGFEFLAGQPEYPNSGVIPLAACQRNEAARPFAVDPDLAAQGKTLTV